MSKQANHFLIGLFVLVALASAAAIAIIFGSGMLNKQTIPLLTTFDGSANGLRAGAKVKAYGVEIGSVKEVMLQRLPNDTGVVIPVLLEIDTDHIASVMGDQTEFDSSRERYEHVLRQGLHASLKMESMVTGMLYVDLAFGLEGEGYLLETNRFEGIYAIPTAPTATDEMKQSLQAFAENLGQTDISGLVNEVRAGVADIRAKVEDADVAALSGQMNGLMADVRKLVSGEATTRVLSELTAVLESFHQAGDQLNARSEGTLNRLDSSLEQMTTTLAEVEQATAFAKIWIDPDNRVYNEIIASVDQLSDAMRSLRTFVDYLERNPNALLTGKSKETNK